MPKLIACAHPGKIGDALWSLPAVRALCAKHEAQADFYTSEFCYPMKDLVEAQPYIRQMIVSAAYELKATDCGCQPPEVPINATGYEAVYQMGFKGCPAGCIGEYIAEKAGLPREVGRDVHYEVPMPPGRFVPGTYVVLSPRGETSYAPLLRDLAIFCENRNPSIPTVEVGALGQGVIPESRNHRNVTCKSMLEMASIISCARAFVGLMSSPLVIANGFPDVPKIVPHNGRSWDMSHVLYTPNHHYVVDPTIAHILNLI